MDRFNASHSNRKINHTRLSSWSQYGLQIKKLQLLPWAGLMDFQGKVQTSLAGCVGMVSSVERNGSTAGLGRHELYCSSSCFPSCGLGDGGLSWGRISILMSDLPRAICEIVGKLLSCKPPSARS